MTSTTPQADGTHARATRANRALKACTAALSLALAASVGMGIGSRAVNTTATSSTRTSASVNAHNGAHKQSRSKSRDADTIETLSISTLPRAHRAKGGGFPGDDYPYKDLPQDSEFDPWGEYVRECTSFVAWALHSRNDFTMPFYDNANKWGSRASALGYAVNGTPAIGSVAWSNAGTYGHVAWVEAVNGSTVTVQQYNADWHGHWSRVDTNASRWTGFIHFKDIAVPAAPPQTTPAPTAPPATNGPQAPPLLQGGNTNIQGSSPTLQGGSQPAHTQPSQDGSSQSTTPSTATPPRQPSATPPAATPPTTQPTPVTYTETTGGPSHTWTNYTNAGGYEGATIPSNGSVQISCKVAGFRVADGNTWWYRIASAPWNNAYFVSADAFYNNGATSGSLHGTPFVDPAVPNC